MTDDSFATLTYDTRDRKAYITLNRPERSNAIDERMPRRDPRRRRTRERRRRGARDRAPRCGSRVLRRLRPQAIRGDRRRHPGRRLGSDQGLPGHEAQHRRLLHAVPIAQADDLQGARLCRGRRQRHRTVVRPRRDGRRRAHRVHAGPRLGLPDDRDVGVPTRRRAGEAHAADRRHDRRPDGRGVGARARGRRRPPSSTPASRSSPTAWPVCRSISWSCRS